MRITICAVGRLKSGPEAALVSDYLARFDRVGRGLGLGPASVAEVDAKGGGRAEEGRLLAQALPKGAIVCALDERGAALSSEAFAERLMRHAERGERDLAFLIGGADGIEPGLRERADLSLSFGAMVWPHLLARVMLAEQLYRGASILAGTPYHRGG
jgi:23S rRNA (pseudouridine1915-N3)-methyltransferase